MNIFLILPTQLFRDIKNLNGYDKIYILEEKYYINPNKSYYYIYHQCIIIMII